MANMTKPKQTFHFLVLPRGEGASCTFRVQVSPRARLATLDKAIQRAMGCMPTDWSKFQQDGREYGVLFPERGEYVEESRGFAVSYLFMQPGDQAGYECLAVEPRQYDIVLEAISEDVAFAQVLDA